MWLKFRISESTGGSGNIGRWHARVSSGELCVYDSARKRPRYLLQMQSLSLTYAGDGVAAPSSSVISQPR